VSAIGRHEDISDEMGGIERMKRSLILVLTLAGAVLLTGLVVRGVAATHAPSVEQPVAQATPASPSSNCEDGEQASGAKYRICTPTLPITWNGDLVVYAHGYVAPDRPVEIPEDQMSLPGFPLSVDEIVTSLGYGFATTSYYTNGLAVRPAIADLLDVVDIFSTTRGVPARVYLVGVSEGGLITTLSLERHPEVYDGGLAMCGPYGDFRFQTNHFGDFRVVFDYFFPDLMPGEPISIPTTLADQWKSGFFTQTIEPEITDPAHITRVNQLLNVTDVSPYEVLPPTSTASIEQLLWYNVFATNDAVRKLGGQPFDNADRRYTGSNDDDRLNDPEHGVERISADPAALDEIADHYQTTGELSVPLVTLHTTGDEVVPYRHATLYRGKTILADNIALHRHFEVDRHGHCNFQFDEILGGFITMVNLVTNPPPYQPVERVFLPSVVRASAPRVGRR
jgi:pimeloyl-ACP methyl ester carboxylesterase